MQLPILSILIFFPLLGIGLLLLLDRKNHKVLKGATLGLTLVEFVVSLPLWFGFNNTTAAMQFVERHQWIPSYGI
ncbi:MAG TPA: Fe-S-binding domain-containing protein, partial [Desulfobaccales bacterium]